MRFLPDRVFHLVDALNYASVRRHGLLSAAALVERAVPHGPDRAALLRRHRRDLHVLPDGTVLRDQRPMPPEALASCLDVHTTPADWYARLNALVFFWLDPARARAMQNAYTRRPQWLLTLDTARLLARHGDAASVTPINTGYAWRKPSPRSPRTFVPLASWQAAGWAHEGRGRSPGHRPVELVFSVPIPDLDALEAEPPILISSTRPNP